MKRVPTVELLDSDSGSPEAVSASLKDLRLINRAFGGISTTRDMVARVARKTGRNRMSLLEVAAGASNVPEAAAQRLRRDGVQLDITVSDRAASHLNGTRPALAADALALPFASGSFDLVSSSLFAHHLMPADFQQFAREALRVARVAVLINDLVRSPVHLALVYLGLPLFRSRLTWHDAPASVRQAYTIPEMRHLLKDMPATRVEISRHFLFHMGVIAWRH